MFSKGQFNSPNCVYVKPYTSLGAYTFDIYFNKCGTKPDLNGKFYENTIIVQYDNELIEVSCVIGGNEYHKLQNKIIADAHLCETTQLFISYTDLLRG